LGATSVYKCDKGLFAMELCVLKCVQRCVQSVQSVSEWLTRRHPIMARQVVGESKAEDLPVGHQGSRLPGAKCFFPPGRGLQSVTV